jgi:hypothetical protein
MFKKSLGLVSSLCVVAAFSGAANMAVAAAPEKPAATAAAGKQSLALLDGKLSFTLQGFAPTSVPGGGPGTMYVNKEAKRVIIVGEEPMPALVRGASDQTFLDGMKSIKDKQKAASPEYKVTSEKTENVKGLQVHHIEATDVMDGNPVLQATLLAAGNKKFTVIQVISGAKDPAGHAAAVDNILGK